MRGCDKPALLRRFADEEAAATAIEYALIAGTVGVAVISVIWILGDGLKTNFYDKVASMFPSV